MFEFTGKAKTLAYVLILVGIIAWVAGYVMNDSNHTHEGEDHHTEMTADHGEDHEMTHDHGDHTGHGETAAHHEHAEHHAHQHQNRPWSALFVASFFFMALGLGALFFLAVQYAASVGWSAGLTRLMEAVALYMPIPLLVIVVLFVLGEFHVHHIWHWQDPELYVEGGEHHDEIIAGKQGYLNFGFFLLRAIIYLVGWTLAAIWFRKNSLKEDEVGGDVYYKKNFRLGAIFLVFYGITSSTSAWDFIMSIDTHWFSTLFGWYTFAGVFVTSLAGLIMLTIYLKGQGYMEWINENHLQDLGKFMFAFSVFWTYLWFSQFMLIWYSNIPEEVTYYMARFGEYKLWFFIMLALNFAFPVLLIMSRDSKRTTGLLVFTGIFVLVGHYLDHYIMIMPGTVGDHYGFGLLEIGPILFYFGLYILVVFRNLSKAPLLQKNHPMIHESKVFHI
jgi:hypothetical protein